MKKWLLIAGLLVVLLSVVIGCNPKMNGGTSPKIDAKIDGIVNPTQTDGTINPTQKCKFEGFYVVVVKDLNDYPRDFKMLPENTYKDSLSGIPVFHFVMKPGETAYVYPIISPFNSFRYMFQWHLLDGNVRIINGEWPGALTIKTREGHDYVFGRLELDINYFDTPEPERFYLQVERPGF